MKHYEHTDIITHSGVHCTSKHATAIVKEQWERK